MKVILNGLLDALRGGAWRSSARAMRCSVKSENERDLRLQLPPFLFESEHTEETAFERMRKVQATVRLYAPNVLGYTRHTLVGTAGSNSERRSQSLKANLVRIEGCNSSS